MKASFLRLLLLAPVLGAPACAHIVSADDSLVVSSTLQECPAGRDAPSRLRVASYNIKSATVASLDEVAGVIAELDPDVLAIQEVDSNVNRSGGVEQAAWLARELGYDFAFAGAIRKDKGQYGVALLSRLPILQVERVPLSSPLALEPRVALSALVCAGSRPMAVVAAHADVAPWSATHNIQALAERLRPLVGKGLVLLGDLNSLPNWPGPRALRGLGLHDLLGEHGAGHTFIGDPLRRRIDYIFADSPLVRRISSAGILQRIASDHLPIFADLDLRAGF